MWPLFKTGDRVLAVTTTRTPAPGDILLVRTCERDWVAHRYLGDGRFKGDYSRPVERIEGHQVWAIVVGRKRGARAHHWGPEGQRFARAIAALSWLGAERQPRALRWAAVAALWIAVKLSVLFEARSAA